MSIDLKNDEAAVEPEIQAVLDLFDRLSDAAKRETMIRLLRRGSTSGAITARNDDDLDWGDLSEDDHDLLSAQAFAEMAREEDRSRGERSGPR